MNWKISTSRVRSRPPRSRMFAIVGMLALALAACGESVSQEADGESAGQTPAEREADTGTAAPDGGELVLGSLFAMTGGGSWYGEVMSAGAQLGVDEVNADGGVEGYTFSLAVEDHESGSADAAVAGARKLLDVNDAAVMLSSFTAPTVAVQPLTSESGVLLLNGGGVGDDLIGKEGLYNTRMLGAQLMPGLVEWAAEEHDAQRFAVIHWNDAAGRAIQEAVEETCGEVGCEVVASEPHEVDERNYSPMLARVAAADADVLVLGSWGNDVGHILDQARSQGLDLPVIGNEWTPDAQEVGAEAMEGYVAVLDTFDAENPVNEDAEHFVNAYREEYGEAPEFYGANYYELVRFVVPELIRIAVENGEDPTQPGVLLSTMEQAVADGHEFPSIYGDTMVFSEDGTVEKPAGVYRVEDGSLTRLGALEGEDVVEE
jgi:branched-chain amino acid transport system substrate-binding protein